MIRLSLDLVSQAYKVPNWLYLETVVQTSGQNTERASFELVSLEQGWNESLSTGVLVSVTSIST